MKKKKYFPYEEHLSQIQVLKLENKLYWRTEGSDPSFLLTDPATYSLDPFIVVTYYINLVKTSWTYST